MRQNSDPTSSLPSSPSFPSQLQRHCLTPLPHTNPPKPKRSINLHANQLRSVARLPPLTGLLSLNLSSNRLRFFVLPPSLPPSSSSFSFLPSLAHLDLSCNEIRTLDASFPLLPSLLVLKLPFNQIDEVEEWGKGKQQQQCLLPGKEGGREGGREGRRG